MMLQEHKEERANALRSWGGGLPEEETFELLLEERD